MLSRWPAGVPTRSKRCAYRNLTRGRARKARSTSGSCRPKCGVYGTADGTRIRIHQNFQEVELEGQLLGREISASRASLRGRDIMWEANGLRFQGRLQGEVITGELAGPDRRQPFALRRAR